MSTILDVDVLLVLATALAAKRRPAEPVEIVAAIDLIQQHVPGEEKLSEAFARLGSCGLLLESNGGIALSPAAEQLIEILPRKGEYAERLFELKGLLAAQKSVNEGAAIVLGVEQLRTAILAHRSSLAEGGKNLLISKPKPEAAKTRPGQRQRKPMPKSKARKR